MIFEQPRVYALKSNALLYGVLTILFAVLVTALTMAWFRPSPPNPPLKTTPLVSTHVSSTQPPPDRTTLIEELKSHLLAHLPFAGSLNDQAPHALQVTARGPVVLDGDSAFFPGPSYLELPHIDFRDRPFAIAMWIKPVAPVRNYGLLEQNEGPPHKHLFLMLRSSDKPCVGFHSDDLTAVDSVPADVWTHLVFQFTGAQQQIWMNGRQIASRTSDPYKGTAGATLIGKAPRWGSSDTQGYRGHMRDLRIYDSDLTELQIRALAGIELGDMPGAQRTGTHF